MITNSEKKKEKIIEQLGNEGVFDEFCHPFLQRLEEKIDEVERKIRKPVSESIRRDILHYAKGCLIEYSSRTMIFELNQKKLEYDVFCDHMDKNPEEIYRKYPILKIKMDMKMITIEDNVWEIYTRLQECKNEIKGVFQIDVNSLEGIEFGQGDTHNHGKTVSVLSFAEGQKLVYKPRNMCPEIAFTKYCQWLNEQLDGYELINPRVVTKGDYGFQEFVKGHECHSKEEVKHYYRRVGRAMALFYIFDTSDLHGENIIPCGEYPMFIDLETLLTARKRKEKSSDLTFRMGDVFSHSVFATSLLPSVFKDSILDIDISGLGAVGGQKSNKLKCLQLVEKGTTKIHFDEVYFVTDEMDNIVRVNGEIVDYIDYVADIEAGFTETYDVLLENREYVISHMLSYFENSIYRQVLRGTFVYERFLAASLHPNYCGSKKKAESLLHKINVRNNQQGKVEVEQMLEHDVPYFCAQFDGKGLYTKTKLIEEDFFAETLREKVTKNVLELSEEDRERQLAFIRNATMLAKNDIMKENGSFSEKIKTKKGNATVLEGIVNTIRSYAIWKEDRTACTFIDVNIGGKRPVLGSISYSLYDGIGMILFLFAYAQFTQGKEDKDFAEAALAGMDEISPMEKASLSTGVFSGFYGYIYLYYNLYRMTGNQKYYERYQKGMERIAIYDCSNEKVYDVIAGASGAVAVLANIYEYEKDEKIQELISQYCCFLRKGISDNQFWTGFSHGYAGFQFAFMKAYAVTGNMEYLEFAKLLEQKENFYYSKEKNNWLDLREEKQNCCLFWCHGAPGILLGRSYYMKQNRFYSKYQNSLDEMIQSMQVKKQDGFNDSLCHGRVGNLEILHVIARNTKNNDLQQLVEKWYFEEEEKIKQDGVEYGVPQLKGLMSFMVGLPGIGYGLLRIKRKELPSVLGLEVM